MSEGEILKDLQNRAARDLANSEFEMIKPIHKHGERLYSFAKNLGSIFREYHKDPLIRYPETNQFTLDIYSVQDETLRDSFRAALEWSIIQKKSGLQQSSPGTPREEIYTLNRIFSPIFEITYRTRGGYSESFDASDLEILMTQNNVKPKMKLKKKYKDKRQQHLNLKYK